VFAAIDAGSNTLRLLIGHVEDGRVIPHSYCRHITRLAGGYTDQYGLSVEAMGRTLEAFRDFASMCQAKDVSRVRAVGTAAFRLAANTTDFVEKIRSETGISLDIVTGEVEAALMTDGVLSALSPQPENALLVDIGGGSTEFVLYSGGRVCWMHSVPLGVVRLTESCASPKERLQTVNDMLDGVCHKLSLVCMDCDIDVTTLALVGTAGTVTTLAALDMQMTEYDWRRVNNYRLSFSRLKFWQNRLEPLSVAQREALPGMEEGRGDLIVAGIDIILCLMQRLQSGSLLVSDFGILEGLILSLDRHEY